MPTARKTPAGNWRCRVYDNELKKQVSFTAPTKKEAEKLASDYSCGKRHSANAPMILDEAIQSYIKMKSNILSPTTIDKYNNIRKNQLSPKFLSCVVTQINTITVQNEINRLAGIYSPKTVRNANGLISAVLKVYAPELRISVTLPQKQKKIRELPPADVIVKTFKGTHIELEVMLALWLGLRCSEIRGLRKSDFKNGYVTIQRAVVDAEGKAVIKDYPKTTDSVRRLSVPSELMQMIDKLDREEITTRSRHLIYRAFKLRITRAGYPDTTFHDLRHINASVMLMLGIPDKYAMERGGWSDTKTMKNVYQETYKSERELVDNKINDYFSSLVGE